MTQVVTHSDTEGEDEENEKSAPVSFMGLSFNIYLFNTVRESHHTSLS